MTIQPNSYVTFKYHGKARAVRVEKVEIKNNCQLVTGWDSEANHPVGGYRSFYENEMTNVIVAVIA